MRPVKSINKENLLQAIKMGSDAADQSVEASNQVPGTWQKIVANGSDPRDLIDLAFFLKYERKINGTGEVLSDDEFNAEVKNLFIAFADDDRTKIYNYMDRWLNFALNYNPPEDIQTVDEALQNFIYLRAKQGLADTKMRNYPDYVKSRFPSLDSIMELQKLQIEINLQSENCDILYHENGLRINTGVYKVVTEGSEQDKTNLSLEGLAYSEMKPEVERRFAFANALHTAFNITEPNPIGQASVKNATIPNWVKEINVNPNNLQDRTFIKNMDEFHTALRECVGLEQTSSGLISKYFGGSSSDIGVYKFIFVDGVSIYDTLPDPKDFRIGAQKLCDALINRTGVVSFAHAAEINGHFEYKVDTLDLSDGTESAEYAAKIENIKNNEDARIALFATINQNLTPFLFDASNTYVEQGLQKLTNDAKETLAAKEDAIRHGTTYKSKGKDSIDESIEIDRKNIGIALMTIDEVRNIYYRYARPFFAAHPEYVAALNETIEGTKVKCDLRDFADLFAFAKLGGLFGVGENSLDDNQDKQTVEEMLTAFATRDHDGIKKYLDKMFGFLKSYQNPNKIESTDDLIRAVMYIRMQQTSSVKQVENPWYVAEKYPTLLDQGKFEAFETEYFARYKILENAFMKQTHMKVASTQSMASIFATANQDEDIAAQVAEGNYDEIDYQDYFNERRNEQLEENYDALIGSFLSSRRAKIENAQDFEGKYTYKITLPDGAMVVADGSISPEEYEEASHYFFYTFFNNVYTTDYADSHVLRSYHLENSNSDDAFRLTFVDGRSVHDIITETYGEFSSKKARNFLLDTLVKQTGLVQFAHVMQGEDEVKVQLDTIDVSSPKLAKDDYLTKLGNYERNPDPLYNQIKANVNQMLRDSQIKYEQELAAAKAKALHDETVKYDAAIPQDEADILSLGDVFDADDTQPRKKYTAEEGQEKLFKINRANVLRNQLNDISTLTYGRFKTNSLLGRFEEVLGADKLDKAEYCKLWKEVWLQAMDGLKFVADRQDYLKPIPFAYATNMVERCMKGALELYGYENKEVPHFGGMTTAEMSKELIQDVSNWEQKHYEMYYDNMSPNQRRALAGVEFRFNRWKKIPLESYKTLSFTKEADKYRDENGQLNDVGKRWATSFMVELFDRINVMADQLTEADTYHGNVDEVRSDMYDFAEKIRTAALEIGIADEKTINKCSGKASPIADDLEKFKKSMDEAIAFENNLDAERKARYLKEEQEQWDDFVQNGFALFEDNDAEAKQNAGNDLEKEPISQEQIDENKRLSKEKRIQQREFQEAAATIVSAREIDFSTFQGGRYVKSKRDPQSAYALVSMSEMRELEVYFGGMHVDKYQKDYAPLAQQQEPVEEVGELDPSIIFAHDYGLKITHNALTGIMQNMITQNFNSNLDVDKATFSRQYALLFSDLYVETLHNLNKKCCAEGRTITSQQMDESMRLLSKMMQNATRECGYPEDIKYGGFSPKDIKKMQSEFVEKFVPKTTQQQALRKMQAGSQEFDFKTEKWQSGLGYTAFGKLIAHEKSLLGTREAHTPDGAAKIAQLYRAMVMYNAGRTRWSKFWNWRKNRDEKAAIQRFKDSAMKNTNLDVREFDALVADHPNDAVNDLTSGIEQNYQRALHNPKDDSLSNSSDKDYESESQSELNESMSELNESKSELNESKSELNESKSSLNDSMVERISVEEANHKVKVERKREVEKKQEQKREIDNMNRKK